MSWLEHHLRDVIEHIHRQGGDQDVFDLLKAVVCDYEQFDPAWGPSPVGDDVAFEVATRIGELRAYISSGPEKVEELKDATFRIAREQRDLSGRRRPPRQQTTGAGSGSFEDSEIAWYPALAQLKELEVLADTDYDVFGDQARVMLAGLRDALAVSYYGVVEEETDQLLGLNLFPWPRIDRRGRLRFPIDTDPIPVERPRIEIQSWIDESRLVWAAAGLVEQELATPRVEVGNVFAVWSMPWPSHIDDATFTRAHESIDALDVSWDARNASKLAHLAGASGALTGRDREIHSQQIEEAKAAQLLVLSLGGIEAAQSIGPETDPGSPTLLT